MVHVLLLLTLPARLLLLCEVSVEALELPDYLRIVVVFLGVLPVSLAQRGLEPLGKASDLALPASFLSLCLLLLVL